ncbi:glycosyltransferase family 2 protein [Phytopseudomonas dryadis]|uniref:Glycosyltransferase 2-like domain-containing protein n=1 Tax=Phytopseudomonas dryadis TaxID=2487520 RepID=A0A4V2KBQ3_9GAMM|nr:glycosyltransferase family A protein [Pseudomonas dryadis]TBU88018.1 hypothetical protein DNK44_19275 [Pseudomonas dryadis]
MATLSVVLPVHDAAPYLHEALESLLQQSRPIDQIVVVNDGSTDGSQEILERYARAQRRIELHETPNGGVSRARNLGLQRCAGDYIGLMDADDISRPMRFEQQIVAMEKRQLDVCGCALRTFGRRNRTVIYPAEDLTLKANYLFYGRTIPGPAVLLRRSAIGDTRFDEGLRFAEDFGFFLALLMQRPSLRLHNLPQPLYDYRTHATQASQRLAQENENNLGQLLHKWLPTAGIECDRAQLSSHYRTWHEHARLSATELSSYLPLMQNLCAWLQHQDKGALKARSLWTALALRHQGDGEALALVSQAAGFRPSWWRRLAQRLRGL